MQNKNWKSNERGGGGGLKYQIRKGWGQEVPTKNRKINKREDYCLELESMVLDLMHAHNFS